MLAEIQALLASSSYPTPRRTSNGFDYNRAAMLLAVLEKRGQLKVSQCDAYLNIIGGLTLDEPAADLAAILALASSYLDKPIGAPGRRHRRGRSDWRVKEREQSVATAQRGAAARLHGVHHSKAAWEPSWTSGRPEADGGAECR